MEKYPIYHLSFKTQYLLASTFLRFQEFYESPKFAGKVFTLEEFMDWYASEKGEFTYFSDWSGFNIPSSVLKPFKRGVFDPLTKKEARLLEMFRSVRPPFYILATYDQSKSILHEVVHGLFFIDADYRRKVKDALTQLNLKDLRALLLAMGGYGEQVVDDEANAYILTELTKEMKRLDLDMATQTLKALFKQNFGLDIDNKSDQKKLVGRIHKQRFRV